MAKIKLPNKSSWRGNILNTAKGQLKCLHDFLFADCAAVTAHSAKDLQPQDEPLQQCMSRVQAIHQPEEDVSHETRCGSDLWIWAQQSQIPLLLTWSSTNELIRPPTRCPG